MGKNAILSIDRRSFLQATTVASLSAASVGSPLLAASQTAGGGENAGGTAPKPFTPGVTRKLAKYIVEAEHEEHTPGRPQRRRAHAAQLGSRSGGRIPPRTGRQRGGCAGSLFRSGAGRHFGTQRAFRHNECRLHQRRELQ